MTCAELPELDPDDRLAIEPLAARGITVEPAVWSDPGVAWAGFALAVIRSTWDYARHRDSFVAWAREVPCLANPADLVAWNTDKVYLRELAAAGVPVVPTTWVAPDDRWTPPDGVYVIKPAVSAGSLDTGRYGPGDAALARAHVERLQAAGRLVMVQPYLPAVDSDGETALVYLDGGFSHAIRKGPMLTGPDVGVTGLYREEEIAPRAASPAELSVGRAALAALPSVPLYARVDLIPGPDGAPRLVELELTEPSLFLGTAPDAPARLATAIATRVAATTN